MTDLSTRYDETFGYLDFELTAEQVLESGEFTPEEVDQLVAERVISWSSPECSRKSPAATPH